ncbi:MAG: FAD-binding oxidoreductase [Anaerolineae bacterium]
MTTSATTERGTRQADLPEVGLVTEPIELITYEVDGGLDRGAPQAVAFPQNTGDVVNLVRWAAGRGVPLVARGAGTGLSGGAVPSQGGLVLSFSRMKEVLEFDEKGRSIVVQPGVVNLNLDELVKRRGLYYPPDPASGRSSTLGGNIAENAGGPHCFKYGVTTNYVTGLEAVLANGEIIHTGGRAFDYPEYDFTGLLVGSEGTLAVVTQASLRLMRNPPGVKTLMASFDSVEAAGEAVSAFIAKGLVPATMEMMDRNMIGIIEDYIQAGLPTDAAAMLIVEADGYPDSLDPQMEEIIAILRQQGARDLRVAANAAEREQIWYGRKSAFGAISRISPAYYVADGTVPRSKLAGALAEINQICARHDLRVGYVFHAGDGNLHPLVLFDPRDQDMVKRVHQAGREIMVLCVAQDGSISGEHGIGISKRDYMPLMYTPDELAAMRDIKELFDPHELLNPGKILPPDVKSQVEARPAAGRQPLPSPFIPESEEEAADGLRAAQAAGQPVFIRGGASQEGPAPAGETAAWLLTGKLRGVVAYAPEDLYVTARAGTPLAELQEVLAGDGLWAPLVSPWAGSTLGGLLSANLNSPQRMRYGALRDLVLGVRVVLPDGRRLRYGRPVVKNVAGYDMVKLFIGAYGTLGLISEVTLRLTPLPRARRSLLVAVHDLATGLALGQALLDLSLVASAVLLCAGRPRSPELPASPYQLVFTAEGHPQDVTAELAAARSALEGAGAGVVLETETLSGVDLWAGLLRGGDAYIRVGLPPRDLGAYLEANAALWNPDVPQVVDFASGQVYARLAGPEQLLALREAALARGGYAVAVTLDGVGGGEFDPWGYAPETLALMRGLKARWDPAGCLNAGVFLV